MRMNEETYNRFVAMTIFSRFVWDVSVSFYFSWKLCLFCKFIINFIQSPKLSYTLPNIQAFQVYQSNLHPFLGCNNIINIFLYVYLYIYMYICIFIYVHLSSNTLSECFIITASIHSHINEWSIVGWKRKASFRWYLCRCR